MKKLIIGISAASFVLFGFSAIKSQTVKPKQASSREINPQLYSTQFSVLCPVVGDGRPTEMLVAETRDGEHEPYDHCVRCNTGVYLVHGEESKSRCTYCGADK